MVSGMFDLTAFAWWMVTAFAECLVDLPHAGAALAFILDSFWDSLLGFLDLLLEESVLGELAKLADYFCAAGLRR